MATDNLAHGFQFQRLDIYIAARDLAAVVHQARITDAELRDQASRASKSVFLNIAEGLPSESAGIRRRHFAFAHGSLCETVAALDLALVLGAVAPEPAGRAQAWRGLSRTPVPSPRRTIRVASLRCVLPHVVSDYARSSRLALLASRSPGSVPGIPNNPLALRVKRMLRALTCGARAG